MKNFVFALLGLIAGIVITFVFVSDKCKNHEFSSLPGPIRCAEGGFSGSTHNPVTGVTVVYCGQSTTGPFSGTTNNSGTIDPM